MWRYVMLWMLMKVRTGVNFLVVSVGPCERTLRETELHQSSFGVNRPDRQVQLYGSQGEYIILSLAAANR